MLLVRGAKIRKVGRRNKRGRRVVARSGEEAAARSARRTAKVQQLSSCGRGRLWRAEMVWRGRSMRPRRGRRGSDGRLRCGLPEGRRRRCACLRGAAKNLRVCGDGSSRGRKRLRRGSVLGRRQRQLLRVAAGCCGLLRVAAGCCGGGKARRRGPTRGVATKRRAAPSEKKRRKVGGAVFFV